MFQFAVVRPLLPLTYHNPALPPLLRLPRDCHHPNRDRAPRRESLSYCMMRGRAPSRYALTPDCDQSQRGESR